MRPPRHKALVDKAVSACLAAIEIYNKPLFPHREEVFAVMMTNAWELLLKARVLKEGGNKMRAIYEVETPKTKAGQLAKRPKIRLSKAGNPRTITLDAALVQAAAMKPDPLPAVAVDNIRAIEEIRNNAIHFVNADKGLAEKVWELGTGSLRNFMRAAQDWFGCDLSEHRLFMMPLAFTQPEEVAAVPLKERPKEIANLAAFLDGLEKRNAGHGGDEPFVLGLKLEFKLAASRQADAPAVRLSVDPKAPAVRLSEDELKTRFPLTYETLIEKLQERYSDFKVNRDFHRRRAVLEKDPRLTHVRKLDPFNKNSSTKRFYAPGIVDRFDAHYTRKKPASSSAPATGAVPSAAASKTAHWRAQLCASRTANVRFRTVSPGSRPAASGHLPSGPRPSRS